MMKICSHCRIGKPVSEFGVNKAKADGLSTACLPCTRMMQNSARRELRERETFVTPASQRCDECREIKPATDFYKQTDRVSGINRVCKACMSAKFKRYRRRHLIDDPVRFKLRIMAQQAKTRARQEDVPFDITTDYLMKTFYEVTHCPILGIKLNWVAETDHPIHESPSLDKKIPSRGYVPGNVWVISHQANMMKTDATPEMVRRFGKWAVDWHVDITIRQ